MGGGVVVEIAQFKTTTNAQDRGFSKALKKKTKNHNIVSRGGGGGGVTGVNIKDQPLKTPQLFPQTGRNR